MTPRQKSELLREALLAEGHEPYQYSGRMMYGRGCLAVNDVSEWNAAVMIADQEGNEFGRSAADLLVTLGAPSRDRMGLGFVLYWPHLPWFPEWDLDDPDSDEE